MPHPVHRSRPPDIDPLLDVLEAHGPSRGGGIGGGRLRGVAVEPADLDIVPAVGRPNLCRLVAAPDALMCRATELTLGNHMVWVTHVDDLLAGMTIRRRDKDAPRSTPCARFSVGAPG